MGHYWVTKVTLRDKGHLGDTEGTLRTLLDHLEDTIGTLRDKGHLWDTIGTLSDKGNLGDIIGTLRGH